MVKKGHEDAGKVRAIHAHLHSHLPSDPALRVKAVESLLVEKGLLDSAAVDAVTDLFTHDIGPQIGASIVAKAWSDPDFKTRLLDNATETLTEMGFAGAQGAHYEILENTPTVHNMVVCTLCSCYPFPLLGLPPTWYKSAPYRARAVRDPRGVLSEFGVTLPESVEVRVWDSTSELRYMVLPMRPDGTDDMDEAALAGLVTRDSMIGTNLPTTPGEA